MGIQLLCIFNDFPKVMEIFLLQSVQNPLKLKMGLYSRINKYKTMDIFRHLLQENQDIELQQHNNEIGPWMEQSITKRLVSYKSQKPRSQQKKQKFMGTRRTINQKCKIAINKMKMENEEDDYQASKKMKGHQGIEVLCFPSKIPRKTNTFQKEYHNRQKSKDKQFKISKLHHTIQWQPLTTKSYLHNEDNLLSFFKKQAKTDFFRDTDNRDQGSIHFQKILKLKEKIRMKNNSYVRKLKSEANAPTHYFPNPFEHTKPHPNNQSHRTPITKKLKRLKQSKEF